MENSAYLNLSFPVKFSVGFHVSLTSFLGLEFEWVAPYIKKNKYMYFYM